MTRRIAWLNEKGGAGKSTSAINLAANLATRFNKAVLLIDLDPQANTTAVLTRGEPVDTTLTQVLTGDVTARKALVHTHYDRLDLLPAAPDLADVNIAMADPGLLGIGREHRLRRALAPLEPEYDFVVIDTGPQRTLLNINALNYVHEVFVPIDPAVWSIQGGQRLEELIAEIRDVMGHPRLRLAGALLTKVEHTNVAKEVEAEVRALFGDRVFRNTIPKNIKVEEAHSRGMSVLDYAPESPGARAYLALTEEILSYERTRQEDRHQQPAPEANQPTR